MNCEFEQITERVEGVANFRCTRCGRIVYRCKSPAHKIFAACQLHHRRQLPTLLEMAASAAKAAGNFVASGGQTVAGDVQRDRMATCRPCPFFDAAAERCTSCGCFVALKTWLPNEKCPEGKW